MSHDNHNREAQDWFVSKWSTFLFHKTTVWETSGAGVDNPASSKGLRVGGRFGITGTARSQKHETRNAHWIGNPSRNGNRNQALKSESGPDVDFVTVLGFFSLNFLKRDVERWFPESGYDSDFDSNYHFESHLFGNGLYENPVLTWMLPHGVTILWHLKLCVRFEVDHGMHRIDVHEYSGLVWTNIGIVCTCMCMYMFVHDFRNESQWCHTWTWLTTPILRWGGEDAHLFETDLFCFWKQTWS